MANSHSRVLVCCFTLPTSLHPADIADWISQMVTMHSGIRVAVIPEVDSLRIFANSEEDRTTVRCAIDTNREDWRNAGVTEIRPAA